jgi:hypothetical protein
MYPNKNFFLETYNFPKFNFAPLIAYQLIKYLLLKDSTSRIIGITHARRIDWNDLAGCCTHCKFIRSLVKIESSIRLPISEAATILKVLSAGNVTARGARRRESPVVVPIPARPAYLIDTHEYNAKYMPSACRCTAADQRECNKCARSMHWLRPRADRDPG